MTDARRGPLRPVPDPDESEAGAVDPAAPDDLADAGLRFWNTVTTRYDLSDSEVVLMEAVARLLDEVEELREVLARDGFTTTGSTGQVKVHPAVAEMRGHRLAISRLLAQLALPDEDGATLASGTQARARQAAGARWAGHEPDLG